MMEPKETYVWVEEITGRPVMTVIFEDAKQAQALFDRMVSPARKWRGRYYRMANALLLALEPVVRSQFKNGGRVKVKVVVDEPGS